MLILLHGFLAAIAIGAVCYGVGAFTQAFAKAMGWDPPFAVSDNDPKTYTGFIVLGLATITGLILFMLGLAVSGGRT